MKIFIVAYEPIRDRYVKENDLVTFSYDSHLDQQKVAKVAFENEENYQMEPTQQTKKLFATKNWYEDKFNVNADMVGKVIKLDTSEQDIKVLVQYGGDKTIELLANDVYPVIPMRCRPYMFFLSEDQYKTLADSKKKKLIHIRTESDGNYYLLGVEKCKVEGYDYFVNQMIRNYSLAYDWQYFDQLELQMFQARGTILLWNDVIESLSQNKTPDPELQAKIDRNNEPVSNITMGQKPQQQQPQQNYQQQQILEQDNEIINNAEDNFIYSLVDIDHDFDFVINKEELMSLLANYSNMVIQTIESKTNMHITNNLIDDITEATYRRLANIDIRDYFRKANR